MPRWPFSTVLTLVLAVGVSPPAVAQSLTDIDGKIAGDGERRWIFERIVQHMGSEDCVSGEFYIFKADKTLIKKKCVEKKWRETSHTWMLANEQGGDVSVTIDRKDKYYVLFKETEEFMYMRLRKKATRATEPLVDIELVSGREQ